MDANLGDLCGKDAMRRVSDGRHSIAEIAAHLDFWQRWFPARCQGRSEPVPATASQGWPAVEAVQNRFLAGAEELVAFAERRGALELPVQPAIEVPPLAGYTLGDALVHAATHNSHHLEQVITLRQLMALWPPPRKGVRAAPGRSRLILFDTVGKVTRIAQ